MNPVQDIISHMRETKGSLRPAERRVADAVLADVDFAVHASNSELAQRAEVSEPTVTRFCRTLGCEGVRDFKFKLAQSLVINSRHFQQPPGATGEGSPLPYSASILQKAREAIDRVERQIDPEQVERAITYLAKAKRIMIFGVGGGSTAVAQDAQYRLFRLGLAVTAYSDGYLMRMAASTLGPEDAVIAISVTGRSAEVNQSVEIATQVGVPVVGITMPDSALSQLCTVPLTIHIPETTDIMTPTASRYAYMAVVDLLATGLAYCLGKSALQNLRRMKYNLMNLLEGDVFEPLGD